MDGAVKVGDFGLATALEEKCTEGEGDMMEDRRCGYHRYTDQVGTKLYMSPEQVASLCICLHIVKSFYLFV